MEVDLKVEQRGKICKAALNKFCLTSANRSSGICSGDSGGPNVRVIDATKAQLVGITSTGCSDDLISTHTDLFHFVDWILEVTGPLPPLAEKKPFHNQQDAVKGELPPPIQLPHASKQDDC
jgi:secreted trypsin-like serine protease